MKSIRLMLYAGIALSAIAAPARDLYTAQAYDVTIVRDNLPVDLLRCMVFDAGGRFRLSGETLTMRWAQQAHYPSLFLAVTEPGHRSVVPYHMSVAGALQPDGTLAGSGIYEDGSTFTFHGRRSGHCARGERPARPAADPGVDPTRTGAISDHSRRVISPDPTLPIFAPGFGPCWTPPGYHVPCDPPINPLRQQDRNTVPTRMSGRSYALTLGVSDGTVREFCWAFDASGAVRGASGQQIVWAADPAAQRQTRFLVVGSGEHGQGMGYRGVLLADNLLQVAGVEAFNGESRVTWGYGQSVTSCSAR